MLEEMVEAAVDAGREIQKAREGRLELSRKDGGEPVTRADRAADDLLRDRLLQLVPCGWLSEETADDGSRLDDRRVWVVDPLDGTREFVEGIPEYSVSVALVEDGRPVAAVVHRPAEGDTFWAEAGGGAYRNGKPAGVAEGQELLASRSELDRGEFEPFRGGWEVRPVGSIAGKLGLVAGGEAAATLSRGPKWEWDVCAGSLLVREAGGEAADLRGEPFRFNRPYPKVRGVVAGAPEAYRRVLGVVDSVGASDRMEELEGREGA